MSNLLKTEKKRGYLEPCGKMSELLAPGVVMGDFLAPVIECVSDYNFSTIS
jgi:hypothetical protein